MPRAIRDGVARLQSAVCVAQFRVASPLVYLFETSLCQSLDDLGSGDHRKRGAQAESSTVAMIGGSAPLGSGVSSK